MQELSEQEIFKGKIIRVLAAALVFIGLFLSSLSSYLLFHSVAELFSIAVGFAIFMLTWNSRRYFDNSYLQFIGIAYLFIAFVDLLHTLAFKGMNVFLGYDTNLPTQLWIAGRYLQSVSLLIAPFAVGRRLDYPVLFSAYTAVTAALLGSIFANIFPACYIEGYGLPPFKVISEYIISLILAASMLSMLRKRDRFEPGLLKLVLWSIALMIGAELAFTFYVSVYGLSNLIGHYFKIIAFYLIYKAIIVTGLMRPYDLLFRNLKENEARYRSLFGNMIDGFAYHKVVLDKNGIPVDYVFLEVNGAFERLTGFRREHVIGRKVTEVLPGIKRDPADWIGTYGKVALKGEKIKFENYSEALGKWFSVTAYSPERGYFAAVFEDITERKRLEEKIAHLASFPEMNPDPIVELDSEWNVTYMNPAMRERFPDLPVAGTSHPLLANWAVIKTELRDGTNSSLFLEVEAGGRIFYQAIYYARQMKLIRIYNSDITERKRLEDELLRYRDHLAALVEERTLELKRTNEELEQEIMERVRAESALIEQSRILESFFKDTINPLVFLDKDFNFIRVNHAYARACKRDIAEFPGRNHFEFYPHEGNEAIFRQVVAAKEPFEATAKPFVFPDHPEWGVTYWDWTLVPILDSTGEVDFLVFSLNDVTERQLAWEKVQEQAALLDMAHDAILVRGFDHRIAFWNRGAEALYGWTKAEALGKITHDLLHTRFPVPLEEIKAEILRTGKWEGELFHTDRNGKVIIVESSWALQREKNGEAAAILEINRDITERKEIEKRTIASTTLLKLLNKVSTRRKYLDAVVKLVRSWSGCRCVGIRILSKEGTIPYVSYIGFSKEFWESENALSLEHDHCVCTRIMSGRAEAQDLPVMTSGGSFFTNNSRGFMDGLTGQERTRYRGACIRSGFASMAVVPIRYGEEVIAAVHLADEREGMVPREFIEFFEMISPLIGEAVHKLDTEAERARLAAAVESAADAVVITDSGGIIQYTNPAFERLTGYGRDEINGLDLHMLDSGCRDREFYRKMQDSLQYYLTWSGRLTSRKKDGMLYEEDVTISPVTGPSGEIQNYVVVKRDITEKLRLEAIAEAVNTMNNMGYIISGIRHEIGNPVNSVKMALNILRMNLGNYSQSAIREYLDRSLNELARIDYLLRTLKSFNMFENPELQTVELPVFLEKLLALIKNDFEKKGIAISVGVEPDAKRCSADPRALQQVILNILTNAVDACEGRTGPRIAITAQRHSGIILIRVADNGCGMTGEQQKDLFKPFRTTKAHGTGLGLVIARKMMIRMNGDIEVESRPGEGTTVSIYVPEARDED